MSKKLEWWERDIIEIQSIKDKYKDATYEELLQTVVKSDPEYARVDYMETIMNAFDLPFGYSGFDVPFLTEYPSALTWRCTDTQVGVFFIFFIEDDGTETPVGVREQIARKSNSVFLFFNEVDRDRIKQGLLALIQPDEDRLPSIISLTEKVFNP